MSTATVDVIVLAEPACEVFMNYPYTPDGGAADLNSIELFFSDKGCFELYAGTKTVTWTDVTINGGAVSTTSQPGVELREFAPVSQANRDTGTITLDGTATLVVGGQTAVIIEFGIEWNLVDDVWTRDNSTFRGRGSDDVTIHPSLAAIRTLFEEHPRAGTFTSFDGVGHWAAYEAPRRFNAALADIVGAGG